MWLYFFITKIVVCKKKLGDGRTMMISRSTKGKVLLCDSMSPFSALIRIEERYPNTQRAAWGLIRNMRGRKNAFSAQQRDTLSTPSKTPSQDPLIL